MKDNLKLRVGKSNTNCIKVTSKIEAEKMKEEGIQTNGG